MANTLQLKRSATAGKVPTTAQLALGEMAFNTNDGRLYGMRNAGSNEIVEFLSTNSAFKTNVVAATTANVTVASAAPNTLDGVSLAANDRILVKNQTAPAENGIYVVTTLGTGANGVWARATDCDTASDAASAVVSVRAGTVNGGDVFYTSFKSTDTLGTTAMTWVQINPANYALLDGNNTFSGSTNTFSNSIGVGSAPAAGFSLSVTAPITGATSSVGISSAGVIQSDVTNLTYMYRSQASTAAAAFTLANLTHYVASQGSFGAGSAVTSQYGFYATGNLIGATNNFGFWSGDFASVTSTKVAYGFYSVGNVASGGGTTWAFYGAGTANSYIGGNIGIGRNTNLGFTNLDIGRNITGAVTAYGVSISSTVQSDVTTNAFGVTVNPSTAAAAFTLANLYYYNAGQGTFGAGSTVTTQYGFTASGGLIGATTNYGFFAGNTAAVTAGKTAYGFYSGVNVQTGGGTTFGFYAGGTAANRFSGDVTVFGAGGLGYSTGSGGAVTQITSRTTGVTLNKTNGAITLVSAAGSTAWQSITVTNSTVAATDVVKVCQKSGTDLYLIHVTAVAAGSFRITYATTGGVTTETPVFNFAVIKAATA